MFALWEGGDTLGKFRLRGTAVADCKGWGEKKKCSDYIPELDGERSSLAFQIRQEQVPV